MRIRLIALQIVSLVYAAVAVAEPTLREVYRDAFLIGVALDASQVDGRNARAAAVAGKEFSAVTAENAMKWQGLQPEPGKFHFAAADAFVVFAEQHRMAMIGHTLTWHSQTPAWVFQGENGVPATRDQLLERLRDHIHRVMGRYQGRIKGWDVVNEAIADGGDTALRDSPWRRIIGEDFLDFAFRYAHEADPLAELYYNDYGLENPQKRERALGLLRGMIERGVPITGVGIQGHYHLNHPSVAEIEQTIQDISALGLKVMITELDVDVLPARSRSNIADISRKEAADPALNPYTGELPAEIQQKLAARYRELFELFLRHRKHITRVTFWGLNDGQSWLNDFPIRGRTNHPLLFSRELLPKPAYVDVIRAGQSGE